MKSKEERDAIRLIRKKETQERMERFPHASLASRWNGHHVILLLKTGDHDTLMIKFKLDTAKDWEETCIFLDDKPLELLFFIRALMARYNAIVEDLNATAGQCHVVSAEAVKLK